VRAAYARLVAHVQELSGADSERIDDFFRYGAWLNAAAAMGVEDLSVGCEWMQAELAGMPDPSGSAGPSDSAGTPGPSGPGA
jgi:hypothetical protein